MHLTDLLPLELVSIDGRHAWRDPQTGRTVWHVSGGNGEEGAPPPVPPAPAATLTQADIDAAVATATAAATAARDAEYAAFLAAEKDRVDLEQMSEVDRLKAEAANAKTAADADRAAAAQERLDARIERALAAAGVPEPGIPILVGSVRVATDAGTDTIKAAVETLKASLPGAFGTPAGVPPTPKPPGGTAAQPPAGGQPANTAQDRAAARLAQRHPQPKTAA